MVIAVVWSTRLDAFPDEKGSGKDSCSAYVGSKEVSFFRSVFPFIVFLGIRNLWRRWLMSEV